MGILEGGRVTDPLMVRDLRKRTQERAHTLTGTAARCAINRPLRVLAESIAILTT